ncbi:MAG: hypothetical protein IPN29_10760 [Saprospiraceae bacterium]|nr:hypothetical protein [Saprospiraceae bacterium]
MMMDTDEYMYPLYPAEITDLYEEMTESFLTKHIGKNSYVFMDELFAHLNQIKAVRIVNKLGMMIEMKFPHRSRLEDHLK